MSLEPHLEQIVGDVIEVLVRAATLLAIGLHLGVELGPAATLVWPAPYFVFPLGYAGVRVGRKTYVVDMAGGDRDIGGSTLGTRPSRRDCRAQKRSKGRRRARPERAASARHCGSA